MRTASALRAQAGSCRSLGSPMYGDLLERLAVDVDAGGPVGDDEGMSFGDPESALTFPQAWAGRRLPPGPGPVVAVRAGCDLAPVDAASVEGRLTLTAYTWPDQTARLDRLLKGCDAAVAEPVRVTRQDAVSYLKGLALEDGATTVVWHSVMWQYLSRTDQRVIEATLDGLGSRATGSRRLARVFLEPTRRTAGSEHEFLVVLRVWPSDTWGDGPVVLGRCTPHGPPVVWEEPTPWRSGR